MTHFLNFLVGRNLRNRKLLPQHLEDKLLSRAASTRYESTSASSFDKKLENVGRIVAGLSLEEVESNSEIKEFLLSKLGFGKKGGADITNGVSIPAEVLKKFGIEDEEVTASERKCGNPRVDAGLGDAEQESLNIRVLRTYLRSQGESSKRLRYNGIIPGILYGSDPSSEILSSDPSSSILLQTPWSELQRELDRYHRRFESHVYDLSVFENEDDTEGTVHRVVPSSIQRHPVKGSIYCANFLRYHAGRPLKIPLTYVNEEESPALKRDGFIIPVKKHVECFVEEGVTIPDAIEVECTGLQVKDIVRMDRLIFPDGVKPIDKLNRDAFEVGPVRGGRSANKTDDGNDVSEVR